MSVSFGVSPYVKERSPDVRAGRRGNARPLGSGAGLGRFREKPSTLGHQSAGPPSASGRRDRATPCRPARGLLATAPPNRVTARVTTLVLLVPSVMPKIGCTVVPPAAAG